MIIENNEPDSNQGTKTAGLISDQRRAPEFTRNPQHFTPAPFRETEDAITQDAAEMNFSGPGTLIEQADARTDQANLLAHQADTRTDEADTRTDEANTRTDEANTRTDEANTRTEEANTRTEEANTRTNEANTRTNEANTRTDLANTRTDEANTRTEQAENREQGMRASELSYRRLFETAKDGILILDAGTGMIVDVNPFLEELLGYSHAAFLGKKIWELGFLKDLFTNEVKFAELQEKEYVRYENLPLETAQGLRIEVEFVSNVYLVNQQKVIQCSIRDISERKRLEQALESSMEEVRALNEAIPQLVWATRPDGWNIYFNRQWFDYTGLTPEESLGHGWNKPFHPDDQQRARETWQRAMETCGIYSIECRLRRKDGVYRWWLIRGVPHLDASGQILRWFGTCTDVHDLKQTEIRLMRLAAILESSEDAIIGQDLNGIITDWNNGAQKLFGYTADEMMGNSITRMIPADRQGEDIQLLIKIRSRETIGHFETLRLTKDGRLVDVSITVSPIKNAAGQVLGVSKIVRDISERKREEQVQVSRNMLANILDSIPQSVYWKDHRSVYLGCNGSYARMVGLASSEEIVGKSNSDLPWPRQEGEASIAEDSEVVNGTQPSIHLIEALQRIDGTRPWIETTKLPLIDTSGQIFGLLGVLEDISERKAMEIKLTEALITAEAGNRAKSEFLGIMSHELRTPLNGVLGCTELLTYTPLDDEQKTLANTVTQCGEHLLSLIRDILDFSSIEAAALKIQVAPMALAESVELSALAVRPTAVAKGIALRCETTPGVPDQITGDALRIRQILINLLGNAVKFTSEGSVTLRISPDTDGRFLEFSVEDTGIGMSPETIKILFKPFSQSDSTSTRAFGGTGLGLAISKRLAEAMGGSITVTSVPGTGSTFTLRLPLESATVGSGAKAAVSSQVLDGESNKGAQSHHCAPSEVDGAPPPLEGHLVLVVEDNPENALMAGKMLQSLGYRAEFATNGAEAVEACQSGRYFAILMDVVMPMMDGLEATTQIRELESDSHVPIIALTANVMPGDSARYIAGGMDDYLSKPFNRKQLAGKLAAQSNGITDSNIAAPHHVR